MDPITRTGNEKTLKLEHAQLAQDFAEKVALGRIKQVADLLQQQRAGRLHSVEALFMIRDIVNKEG